MSDALPVAVVVGATGTLGGAVAQLIRSRGIEVVAIGRDIKTLTALQDADAGITPCVADLSRDDAIDAIAAAVTRPVRFALMSAGLPVRGSALTIETGGLAAACNLKVDGFLRLLRGLDAQLGHGSRGAVLTGFLGQEPTPHEAAPGAINAAVANLVRQCADLYGPRGVTMTAIMPGAVDSPRLRSIANRVAAERELTLDEVMNEYRARSPLGELVTVEQVAWAAGLLLDEHASCLHGSTLSITGGRMRSIF